MEIEMPIEPQSGVNFTPPGKPEDFAALPFFGTWRDREDVPESGTWVEKERQEWHQRVFRQE
jgi:hypothetical protein